MVQNVPAVPIVPAPTSFLPCGVAGEDEGGGLNEAQRVERLEHLERFEQHL